MSLKWIITSFKSFHIFFRSIYFEKGFFRCAQRDHLNKMVYKKRKQNKIVKANKLCCDVCSLESYKRALLKHTATFHYKYVVIAFMSLCANI